ncbi:MAG: proline dehydrogenase family protein [Vicinamibacteria bacterium]
MMRSALLWASENKTLRESFPKYKFAQAAVRKFMPGEKVDDALREAARLNGVGEGVILTRLGENVLDKAAAQEVADHYSQVFATVAKQKLRAEVSVKPTQLGLDLPGGLDLCKSHLDRLCAESHATGNVLWIDMESSKYTDVTLELYRHAKSKYPNVGLALQAYLYRTMADMEALLPLKPIIRLVKGAYLEPEAVAFPKKSDVDENFFKLAERLMKSDGVGAGARAVFGTHDDVLHERLQKAAGHLQKSQYEFHMLYGIRNEQQKKLIDAGYTVFCLISYGEFWFPWYMRRLAERPANVWFVVKTMFRA